MSPTRKMEIAFDEKKPVRIKLTDGIVYDRVMIAAWDGNDFEILADDELIRKCNAAGRYCVCVLEPDEIEEVEILE